MEDFRLKSICELGDWLKSERFSDKVVETFEEQEIDGEAFLLMSVDDIVSLVSSKGAQLKLAEKRRQLSTLKPGLAMRESTPTALGQKSPKRPRLTLSPIEDHALDDLGDSDDSSDCVAVTVTNDEVTNVDHAQNDLDDSDDFGDCVAATVTNGKVINMDKENCNPSDNSRSQIKLSNSSSCVSRLIRVTQRKQEQPLPKPFPFPQNFPPVVAMGLEKRSLARTKFVTTLANAIFMDKSYPSTSDLRDVIRIAHQKWDFLAAATGDDWLLGGLQDRFKYFRNKDRPSQLKTPKTSSVQKQTKPPS